MSKEWHKTKAGQKYYGKRTNVYLSNDVVKKIIKISGKRQMITGKTHSINDVIMELVNREYNKKLYPKTREWKKQNTKKKLSEMSYTEYRLYMNEAQRKYRAKNKDKINKKQRKKRGSRK